ncbi:MAG: hypothetical protein AAGG38_04865 [Planctomycetota bacterium]
MSIVAGGLAAFTGLFFYVGVNRLGGLARDEQEFEFGLLLLFIGVLILLCLGALVGVYQQLQRRVGPNQPLQLTSDARGS